VNLNRLGTGKNLIKQVMEQGNLRNMGWTREQQRAALEKQKNSHTAKTRKLSK
jgi:hypothetical protein